MDTSFRLFDHYKDKSFLSIKKINQMVLDICFYGFSMMKTTKFHQGTKME